MNKDEFIEKYNKEYLDESAINNLNEENNNVKERIYGKEKISVVIPTYNREIELKECINSILKQTYNNFEIIVIDDGSNDKIKEEIKLFCKKDERIHFYANKHNSGAGYSRKVGYEKTKGDYIIFCDDDDYYIDNNYFFDAVNIMKKDEIVLICSNACTLYEKENKYEFNAINVQNMIKADEYLRGFQFKYSKPSSTFPAFFRKSTLEKADFRNMKMVNDSSIYLRALINGGMVYINKKIIGIYRVHSRNISFNIKATFILENLKEKKYIYDEIKRKNIFDNADKWFQKQIEITTKYFLFGSCPNNKEKSVVYNWIKNNYGKSIFVITKLKLYDLAYKLKIYQILAGLKRKRDKYAK